MARSSPDLYGIVVHIATHEECGGTAEEWAARRHHEIEIKGAATLATKRRHSPQEVHAAFEWVSGIICRAGIVLTNDVEWRETKSPTLDPALNPGEMPRSVHHCSPDPDGLRCGVEFQEGNDAPPQGPEWCARDDHEVPWVSVYVPTEHVEQWAAYARKKVAAMVAANRQAIVEVRANSTHHQNATIASTIDPREREHT